MNYIAHLHLAKLTSTSYAGNLLGDFSWTPDPSRSDLMKGWRLHQAVDTFVDQHPQSSFYRALPRQGRRRFAGIIQDIAMDYWLVNHWRKFESESFQQFAVEALKDLSRDKNACPPRLQSMITSLEAFNWLSELGSHEGAEKAIASIQRRWPLGEHLTPFKSELSLVLAQAEQPFLILYPDLIEEAKRFVSTEF